MPVPTHPPVADTGGVDPNQAMLEVDATQLRQRAEALLGRPRLRRPEVETFVAEALSALDVSDADTGETGADEAALDAERAGWAANFEQLRESLRRAQGEVVDARHRLAMIAATVAAMPHDSACPGPAGGRCGCWRAHVEPLLGT